MDKPRASVVVLTLNSAACVERCLRSLQRQTLQDFEVLIVDPGSTDNTRAIVDTFDARFKWLELPKSDMGAARNHGMRHSQGEFICFLDSDDFYLPGNLERQVSYLQEHTVDVTYCSAWHFRTGHAERVGLKKLSAQPELLKDYVEGRNHNLNTMCMRRRVWESGFAFGEGERGRYGEEWSLQLRMAQGGVRMAFRPEPLAVVEIRPDSHTLWSRQWKMKQQALGEIEQVASLLTPAQRTTVNVSRILDEFRRKLTVALLLAGRTQEAKQTATSITDPTLARKAARLVAFCRWLPHALVSRLLRVVWLWRQNRSFDWHATPSALRAEFAAVQGGGRH